ncbi:WD40 repeat-like protein [Rozella allomycis CSF55]|uniref:WD40 repeat-like protein n=1 Tax=Rozella allomycis (strain CSF55) TaxID=988480 RepID=A0A4P9YIA0_ROZAC|nr:WD40 repeat-like protein [Rozella allomycis CSF55]
MTSTLFAVDWNNQTVEYNTQIQFNYPLHSYMLSAISEYSVSTPKQDYATLLEFVIQDENSNSIFSFQKKQAYTTLYGVEGLFRPSSLIDKFTMNSQFKDDLKSGSYKGSGFLIHASKSFLMVDICLPSSDPLVMINFAKCSPTCHDLNLTTKNASSLDILIGLSNGEILVYCPLSNYFVRHNKWHHLSKSPVSSVRWLPASEERFAAAFNDGIVAFLNCRSLQNLVAISETRVPKSMFQVRQLPVGGFVETIYQFSSSESQKLFFSPDYEHLAIVSKTGIVRIIEHSTHKLCFSMKSFFGGYLSATWSFDGKYILLAGEDDCITILDIQERTFVARCQGHKSFVSQVAFDPATCGQNLYRFVSVGHDGFACFWEFSRENLRRPRSHSTVSMLGKREKRRSLVNEEASERGFGQIEDIIQPMQLDLIPIVEPVYFCRLLKEPLVGIAVKDSDFNILTSRCGVLVLERQDENRENEDEDV